MPKRFKASNEKTATIIPGAGVGPELMEYLKKVLKTINAPIKFEEIQFDSKGEPYEQIEKIAESIERNGVAVKGNIESCSPKGVISRNVNLRNKLDLFAYIFHCRSYPTVTARHSNVDIVIIRQNTGGEYSLLEHEAVPGVTECLKVMSQKRCERLATYAFEYAVKNCRKRVTTIHKANIMKLTDGLFLETSKRIAKQFSNIEHKDMIVDNCCMQIVSNPKQFDVMLTTNLYGSIVGNVLAGLAGGPALWSGINYGKNIAVFEPALRTTGSCVAGKGIANPIAMLNAGVDLLCYLDFKEHSNKLSNAISHTLSQKIFTPDLNGCATTSDVMNSILQFLKC